MAEINQFYLEHINKEFQYRAAWEPKRALFLGAIITLEKGIFSIVSSLEKEGIPMEFIDDPGEGILDYSSNETAKIGVKLSGQAPLAGSSLTKADAGFNIEFSSDKAVVCQLDNTVNQQITNIAEIEREVLKRVDADTWKKEWLIVTVLMKAGSSTIIISNSSNSKIELKASAAVKTPGIKLTDASLGLSAVNTEGKVLKFIAEKGTTPLYRAMGYHHPLFGSGKLRTKGETDQTEKNIFSIQPFDPAELE